MTAPELQTAVSCKGTVTIPQGPLQLAGELTVSTSGQIIRGHGIGCSTGGTTLIAAPGARGLVFAHTHDTMSGNAGMYGFGWSGFTVRDASAGFVIGDSAGAPDFGAAYCTLSDLCAENCLIGFDFARAGILRGHNLVADGPGKEVAGSVGLRVNGGQPNSIVITGFAFGNIETGVDWSQPGCGNLLIIGDGGAAKTGVKVGSGVQLTIGPGNFEASIDGPVVEVGENASVMVYGVGGHGQRSTPPFKLNGPNAQLCIYNTVIGVEPGVMMVEGGGYGQHVADERGLHADVSVLWDANVKFKNQMVRTFVRYALPDPNADYNGQPIAPGTFVRVIDPDPQGDHLLVMKKWNVATNSWGWEKQGNGNFL